MLTDKYTEKILELYLTGELSHDEKIKFFESLRANPSLNDTVAFVLHHADPQKVQEFLNERSLLDGLNVMSEDDEISIELFMSGMMDQEEEETFKQKLILNPDFKDNALAQAFLIKAIEKIRKQDSTSLLAAKTMTESDVKELFLSMQNEEYDELIDSYLKDSLSKDQLDDFNLKLKSDNEFKDRAIATAMLSDGVKNQELLTQKAINDAKLTSKEVVIATLNRIEMPAAASATISSGQTGINIPAANRPPVEISRWSFMKIAASVIIIFSIGGLSFDYYNSTLVANAADGSIAMVYNDFEVSPNRGDGSTDKVFEELKVAFDNVKQSKDIASTITTLQNYYNSAIDDNADIEDNFVDQISLALATAYIYDGQKSKAIEVLTHMLNDSETDEQYKKSADELLKRINRTFIF